MRGGTCRPQRILQGKLTTSALYEERSLTKRQVPRKTFVDNVCKQVIEGHLLCSLPSLFSPEIVAGYSEADLTRIAAESKETLEKRKHLQGMHASLIVSLTELSHY